MSAGMSPEDHDVLDLFARQVRGIEPLARIWAFGSRARGDAASDSDFDICVVVPETTRALHERIRDVAWGIGFEHERVLTTVILSVAEFEVGPLSASTLVKSIRREGVAA